MPRHLRSGVGGVGSCISRFIHPSKPIRDKYLNRPKGHKLENLTIIAEGNTALASGHLQNGGVLLPTLEFRRALAKECLENTIGMEEGDTGRPRRNTTMSTRVECEQITVKHYCGMWDSSSKKWKKTRQKYQKQRCTNQSNCKKMTRSYCKCTKGLFLCAGCFTDHKLDVLMNC
jgi:hypothetical protein